MVCEDNLVRKNDSSDKSNIRSLVTCSPNFEPGELVVFTCLFSLFFGKQSGGLAGKMTNLPPVP